MKKPSKNNPIEAATHIRQMSPYGATSSLNRILKKKNTAYKLDWNEATIRPSAKVDQALQKQIKQHAPWHWYPDLSAQTLREALSQYTNIPAANILVTNGSDDALQLLCRTYLNKAEDVLVPMPTYQHFLVFAAGAAANIKYLHWQDPFTKDIDTLHQAIGDNTRMVYLVSPNNPSGTTWESFEIKDLCRQHPETLFVVDEAYFEFHGQSVISLTQEFPNLVVTRTFSKAFGLASFRVGYLAAHPSMMENLQRLHNPKSVNHLAQVAATAALGDLEHLHGYVTEVQLAKQQICSDLRAMGLYVHDTPANFIMIHLPQVAPFIAELENHDIYLRDRSQLHGLEHYVRMSIGTRAQMFEVGECIKKTIQKLGWKTISGVNHPPYAQPDAALPEGTQLSLAQQAL